MPKKVVVVDDNLTSLTVAKGILSPTYDVVPVKSGAQLLALTQKLAPDLILLDIEMPEMDGFEALAAIRSAGNASPVVFLSGNADEQSRARAMAAGAVGYVAKPFDAASLVETVARHMRPKDQ